MGGLRALRAEVIDPLLADHRGRLFKTTGDGFLVEFGSAVQALTCAIAIQQRQSETPDALQLRIGLHSGDVLVDGDDLFGDGINIAGCRHLPISARFTFGDRAWRNPMQWRPAICG